MCLSPSKSAAVQDEKLVYHMFTSLMSCGVLAGV